SGSERRPHAVGRRELRVCTTARLCGSLARRGVADEVAAKVVELAPGNEHGLSRVYRGVKMTVDEPGRYQLAAGVDRAVRGSVEAAPGVNDPIVLKHDDSVADQLVTSTVVSHNPTALNESSHRMTSVALVWRCSMLAFGLRSCFVLDASFLRRCILPSKTPGRARGAGFARSDAI